MKRVFAFLLFIVVVIAGVFLATKGGKKEITPAQVSNMAANVPLAKAQSPSTQGEQKGGDNIVVDLDTSNFSKFVNSQIPVVVDFWATTCGACRMLEPVLREVAKELKGEMKFGKIAIDLGNNEEIAQKFSIMATPTLIIFKDGKEMGRLVGYRGKEELKGLLKAFLVKK